MNGLVFKEYDLDKTKQAQILNYLLTKSSSEFGHEPDFQGQNHETAPIPDLVVHFYRKNEGATMKDYKKDHDRQSQDLDVSGKQQKMSQASKATTLKNVAVEKDLVGESLASSAAFAVSEFASQEACVHDDLLEEPPPMEE